MESVERGVLARDHPRVRGDHPSAAAPASMRRGTTPACAGITRW